METVEGDFKGLERIQWMLEQGGPYLAEPVNDGKPK